MNDNTSLKINDRWILSARGNKNHPDPNKPYGWLVEKERTISGSIEDTGIIFLTNRECPFHCLMCDLWKNTTDRPVAAGTIPAQISFALGRMPAVRHLKLYNSGSFFDTGAIPEEDYSEIAFLLKEMDTVIVESHPRFIGEKCISFRNMLIPDLQIAVGLETINPDVIKILNKKMTPYDFINSVTFLTKNGISSRAFILLRPPFLTESEGIYWAEQSILFAFENGVECCTVIPVRPGNGAMDQLQDKGFFTPPNIRSLEKVVETGIKLKAGRVFADVWDLALFSSCDVCLEKRIARLTAMNLYQTIPDQIVCECSNK
jgi:archaeosine synthase beta-subunit